MIAKIKGEAGRCASIERKIGGEQESKKLTTIITSREIRKWEQGDLMIKFVFSAEHLMAVVALV